MDRTQPVMMIQALNARSLRRTLMPCLVLVLFICLLINLGRDNGVAQSQY